MMPSPDTIRVRIREVRVKLGLTQEQLAERLGVSQSSVSRLEARGRHVSLNTLERVAGALGIAAGELLSIGGR